MEETKFRQIKDQIASRLESVRERIQKACSSAHRNPEEITIVAVSKKKTAREILAAAELGLLDFGENYVQEWREKSRELILLPKINWHFIGHLQKNKCKYLAGRVALIHSIDSPALLDELQKRLEKIPSSPGERESPAQTQMEGEIPPKPFQRVLLQVKLAPEETKGGFTDTSELKRTIELYLDGRWPRIQIRGLMTIPPLDATGEKARPYFQKLAHLRQQLEREFEIELPYLSMGMSSDLEWAIAEGATHVRIGTAIFGPRV